MSTTAKLRRELYDLRLRLLVTEMDRMHLQAEIRKAESRLRQLETAGEREETKTHGKREAKISH